MATDTEVDGRWEGPSGPIHVTVKRTNSLRDVRSALLALAYLVRTETSKSKAVCVLVDTRLSHGRLQEELLRLRGVLHPEIVDSIHFLVGKDAPDHNRVEFSGSLDNVTNDFRAWLEALVTTERSHSHAPQLPARQIVLATLAQLRLWNRPPVTLKYLQATCSVSYPTVAAVLKELADKGWLENTGERGVRLRHLTAGEWLELAGDHAKQRKVHFFTDPTGQSSPDQLARRLARLQSANKLPAGVRMGGVMGAFRHFPPLDITAAPRLDLSVDADPMHVAELLDAGLHPKTRAEQKIALAVHVARDPRVVPAGGTTMQDHWAGELECLADLIEMGLAREASDMALHMELTNKQGNTAT